MNICTYLSIDTGSSNIRILIKLVNWFSRNSCKLLELLFKKLVPIPPPKNKNNECCSNQGIERNGPSLQMSVSYARVLRSSLSTARRCRVLRRNKAGYIWRVKHYRSLCYTGDASASPRPGTFPNEQQPSLKLRAFWAGYLGEFV